MDDYDFQPLIEGIRACFPAITRSRVAISPSVAAANGNIKLLRAIVAVDERFRSFDVDGLMALLDAHEMVADGRRSIVQGRYDGKPCEIVLVPMPATSG